MKINGDEKRELRPCEKTKKAVEHEDDGDTNSDWCARNDLQKLDKRAGRVRNQGTSQDHSNYSIIEIGRMTETSPEDLRRLAITSTQVKDYQLTPV